MEPPECWRRQGCLATQRSPSVSAASSCIYLTGSVFVIGLLVRGRLSGILLYIHYRKFCALEMTVHQHFRVPLSVIQTYL